MAAWKNTAKDQVVASPSLNEDTEHIKYKQNPQASWLKVVWAQALWRTGCPRPATPRRGLRDARRSCRETQRGGSFDIPDVVQPAGP